MARKTKESNEPKAPADVASIYEEHRLALKGFISKRVDSKEEAEDILQNVFYGLAKIDLIKNPIEHVASWLYRVASNQIIDRRRKRKEERMPTLRGAPDDDDDIIGDLTDIIASADSDPESDYLRMLVWEELNLALSELPAEQRSVFELTELRGFSFKEISETLDITVNTLISRKRYAVLHLRERMKELYDDLISA